jgi:hypothetical protein
VQSSAMDVQPAIKIRTSTVCRDMFPQSRRSSPFRSLLVFPPLAPPARTSRTAPALRRAAALGALATAAAPTLTPLAALTTSTAAPLATPATSPRANACSPSSAPSASLWFARTKFAVNRLDSQLDSQWRSVSVLHQRVQSCRRRNERHRRKDTTTGELFIRACHHSGSAPLHPRLQQKRPPAGPQPPS